MSAWETTLSDGWRVVAWEGMRLCIAIPSYGRERLVGKHPLLAVANLVVEGDQVADYEGALRPAHPEAHIVACPVHGLAQTRNFILESAPEVTAVVQADDDLYAFRDVLLSTAEDIRDVEAILGILFHTALVTAELGLGVFGYHISGVIWERRSYEPFLLQNVVHAECIGILDRTLRFDPEVALHDDVDFSLQAIRRYGALLRHDRFCPLTLPHARQLGGLARLRTAEAERRCYARLVAKWGPRVIRPGKRRGAGITLRVSPRAMFDPR